MDGIAAVLVAIAGMAALGVSGAAAQAPMQAPHIERPLEPPAPAAELDAPPGPTPEGFYPVQEEGQVLASWMIGAPVLGPGEEAIGAVDDILLDAQGRTIGIVVGVGGFLGVGARDVAIDLAAIEVRTLQDLAARPDTAVPPVDTPPGIGSPGMMTLGRARWIDGEIDHVRVPFDREAIEAAPRFRRLD